MGSNSKQDLKSILHPYLFVLKEGGTIKKDFLDYSLMMLLINSSETISSPKGNDKSLSEIVPDMDMKSVTMPAYLGKR